MHLKRIRKDLRNRIIAGLLIVLATIGAFVGFRYQQYQINNLKYQLELKQDTDERSSNYTETEIDIDSIKNEFNLLNSYRILEGSINIKHKYMFTEDSILGLKKKGTISATADVYYQYEINLADAEITLKDNTLNIVLPKPVLNENSVHRKVDTFHIIEDETTMNWLMGDKEGVKIQRYWEDSMDKQAVEEIKDYYNTTSKEDYLNSIAKKEVKDLLNTLGINNLGVKISIK